VRSDSGLAECQLTSPSSSTSRDQRLLHKIVCKSCRPAGVSWGTSGTVMAWRASCASGPPRPAVHNPPIAFHVSGFQAGPPRGPRPIRLGQALEQSRGRVGVQACQIRAHPAVRIVDDFPRPVMSPSGVRDLVLAGPDDPLRPALFASIASRLRILSRPKSRKGPSCSRRQCGLRPRNGSPKRPRLRHARIAQIAPTHDPRRFEMAPGGSEPR